MSEGSSAFGAAVVQCTQCRSASRTGLSLVLAPWERTVLSLCVAGDFPSARSASLARRRSSLCCARLWGAAGFCSSQGAGTPLAQGPPWHSTALGTLRPAPRPCHPALPNRVLLGSAPTCRTGRAPPGFSLSFHFYTTAYKRSDALIAKQHLEHKAQETQYSGTACGI